MAFFPLIAQWHNVPFQNTNMLHIVRRHACNFKEAKAVLVSAQTLSQHLYRGSSKSIGRVGERGMEIISHISDRSESSPGVFSVLACPCVKETQRRTPEGDQLDPALISHTLSSISISHRACTQTLFSWLCSEEVIAFSYRFGACDHSHPQVGN